MQHLLDTDLSRLPGMQADCDCLETMLQKDPRPALTGIILHLLALVEHRSPELWLSQIDLCGLKTDAACSGGQ